MVCYLTNFRVESLYPVTVGLPVVPRSFHGLVVSLVNASNLQNRRLDSLKSVTAEHQLQYVWSEVEIQTESLDIPSLPDLIIHVY